MVQIDPFPLQCNGEKVGTNGENTCMFSCFMYKTCFDVFSPFSAYLLPHDIIAEKGPLSHVHCSPRGRPFCGLHAYHYLPWGTT